MRRQTKPKKGSTAPSIHRSLPEKRTYDQASEYIVTALTPRIAPPPKKYEMVIAGSYDQFLAWCQRYGKNPHDRGNLRYLADPRWIEGWDAMKLVFVMVGDVHRNPVVQTPAYRHAIQLGVQTRQDRI